MRGGVCFEKENVVANDTKSATTWRSGWDSNPRAVSCKLISSQPRYDHFDTAAYDISPWGTSRQQLGKKNVAKYRIHDYNYFVNGFWEEGI